MKTILFYLLNLLTVFSLQAQDYKINFYGAGTSNVVEKVIVENLTQGKSITINGTEVLHLTGTNTVINQMIDTGNLLNIYPNPTKDNATIKFAATNSGKVNIELFDISGKRVGQNQTSLLVGIHSFLVSGLSSGIYTVRISSQLYTYTGKLVSNGNSNTGIKISYFENSKIPVTTNLLKSAGTEKTMQFTAGDRLKITGISGNFSTVVIDTPTQNKTITFPFFACTDADGISYPVVQIGTQIWMAENLKTTKYYNGDTIGTTIPANKDISSEINPKYQWAQNADESNVPVYGRLYTWYAASDKRNIAPKGWHLPSMDEWNVMVKYLMDNGYNYDGTMGGTIGSNKIAKSLAGTTLWAARDVIGSVGNDITKNNATGFTALPGTARHSNGDFDTWGGLYMTWWSSYLDSWKTPYSLTMGASKSNVSWHNLSGSFGFSVRCIKDVITSSSISINGITSNSAILGIDITTDLEASVSERGVCYGTKVNPTIADSKLIIEDGIGLFTKPIKDLSPNTTYYLRAYATNVLGTTYGSEFSFKTYNGTITDIEGNVYNTVKIGSQEWMVENLKTSKFRNGEPIPYVNDSDKWSKLTTGAYCNYNNDETNGTKYGKLYNWYAINDTRNIAPLGWHVSTFNDWANLFYYIKINYNPYDYQNVLTETLAAKTNWKFSIDADANDNDLTKNNSSGFTALPGGYRLNNGKYDRIDIWGYWWRYDDQEIIFPNYYELYFIKEYLPREIITKEFGLSVRCVKD